jgi:transmembrane sensor
MINDMERTGDLIAQRAAEHFASRHGAGLSQRRERDAWLEEDVSHADAYDEFQRLWNHAGGLADDPELQAMKAADLASTRRRRWFRPQRMLAAAAAFVMLFGVGYVVNQSTQAPPPIGYATALGERRTEALSDGSEVTLNTDSAFEVQFSKNRRGVSLKHGEAQFEVAHDASRPFVVSIGGDTVTALGTRFQVRRESNSTVVTLLEGSVEVAHDEERHVLRPNERAVLSLRTGVSISSVDPEFATGWLDGWLRFRGSPLSEVIVEANRYSEHKLRLGDPRLADVQLSGNFHAGDNASIADAVSLILPVRVEQREREIVLMPQSSGNR